MSPSPASSASSTVAVEPHAESHHDDAQTTAAAPADSELHNLLPNKTAKTYQRRRNRRTFAPCNIGRCVSSIMLPFVLGMVLISYLPLVYVYSDGSLLSNLALLVFHLLLFLLLASYFQTWYQDAGTVPEDWHSHVSVLAHKTPYQKCRHTHRYKPPRSHYDPITRRVVLNMDHFCPWVANTVGYHNRKFFILFTAYGCVTCAYAAALLAPFAFGSMRPAQSGPQLETIRGVSVMATALDVTFAVCLCFFAGGHVFMASRNTTSLEGREEADIFDLGWRRNLAQVFGKDPRCWFLPFYGDGPDGDGVIWELRDGSVFGHPHQVLQAESV